MLCWCVYNCNFLIMNSEISLKWDMRFALVGIPLCTVFKFSFLYDASCLQIIGRSRNKFHILDWDLNLGPPVYKKDAMPLSYDGFEKSLEIHLKALLESVGQFYFTQ